MCLMFISPTCIKHRLHSTLGLAGTFFAIPYFAQKIEGNPLLRWDKYMLVVLPNVVGGACFWVGGYMEMVVNDAEYLEPRWSDPVW